MQEENRILKNPPSSWQIFAVFLKMGTFAYGGVFAMLSLLEKELK